MLKARKPRRFCNKQPIGPVLALQSRRPTSQMSYSESLMQLTSPANASPHRPQLNKRVESLMKRCQTASLIRHVIPVEECVQLLSRVDPQLQLTQIVFKEPTIEAPLAKKKFRSENLSADYQPKLSRLRRWEKERLERLHQQRKKSEAEITSRNENYLTRFKELRIKLL